MQKEGRPHRPTTPVAATRRSVGAGQERWPRIVAALGAESGEPVPAVMCAGAGVVLGAAGVGLATTGGAAPGAVVASGALAGKLEDLQATLGTGPGVDAHRHGVPTYASDLGSAAGERWTGFTAPALEAGVRAVFSFPLRLGAIRIGALTVYRTQPGPLSLGSFSDALLIAEVITRAVLATQAKLPKAVVATALNDAAPYDARVHQASGMVSAQRGTGIAEALAHMHARAFADGVSLDAVAAAVVARRLRLDDE